MPAGQVTIARPDLAQLADFQRRHRVSLLCLVCTEVVVAPRLRQELPDDELLRRVRAQDRLLGGVLAAYPDGTEIRASDGSRFVVFQKPSDAVRWALEFLRQSGQLERKLRTDLAVRVGIHVGEVLVEQAEDDPRPAALNGLQVETCLALLALAGPGRVLLSRFAFDSARQALRASPPDQFRDLAWVSHGAYELPALGVTLEVCEVGLSAGEPLPLPADNAQARRLPAELEVPELSDVEFAAGATLVRRIRAAPASIRRSAWIGIGLTVLLGVFFLLAGWLDGFSNDLAYLFRPPVMPDEVVVVEMDYASHQQLNQPEDSKWQRHLYAQIVGRLQAAGAGAIGFDILFNDVAPDAGGDEAFAAALTSHGRVVLGAAGMEARGNDPDQLLAPITALRHVAAWGVVERADASGAVRQPMIEYKGRPSVSILLAKLATGRDLVPPPGAWLNYYGPPGTIARRSFISVLSNEVPAQVFSNRVVFIGANPALGYSGKRGDYFDCPHTVWSGKAMPGVEVNATSFANLVRNDWLRRLSPGKEFVLVLLFGVGAGGLLVFLAPVRAVMMALGLGLFLTLALPAQVWVTKHWFPWLVPVAIQLPVAALWAVAARTRFVADEDRKLRKYLTARRTLLTGPAVHGQPGAPAAVPGGAVTLRLSPTEQARQVGEAEVPDHRLLKCIGRGAYGQVWLARDVLGTHHAVKLIRRAAFTDSTPADREFRGLQKYTPVSRSHPGLVHILHVGRNDPAGVIYYVMELGDDITLGTVVDPEKYQARSLASDLERDGPLPLGRLLELGIKVGEALAFLHREGLIHRDIKPANIIYVRGEPKVADVGLVTEIAAPGDSISFVGTKDYLPPEGPGTPASDVYAFGKLLYVAVTGRPVAAFPQMPPGLAGLADEALLRDLFALLRQAAAPEVQHRFASLDDPLVRLRELQKRWTALALAPTATQNPAR